MRRSKGTTSRLGKDDNAPVAQLLASAQPDAPTPDAHDTALLRAPDPKKLASAKEHAAVSTLLAWGLRGIQFLISALGLKGHLAGPLGFPVGVDTKGLPIRAHLVPGKIDEVALVVAGVHGSEQSGVEVADRLLTQLAVDRPYYTVVVIPRLFPDNVASRTQWEQELARKQGEIALAKYRELRNKASDPGRKSKGHVDPNRQFPDLGNELDSAKPVDSKGRVIEPGNLALMAVIDAFKPSRVVSIHAIKNLRRAGVYADPHPTAVGKGKAAMAKGASALAIDMAKRAKALGAKVPGSERGGGWTSLYPGQDPKRAAKQKKREDKKGRSFGQWGPSMGTTVITVEVGEQYGSGSAVKDPKRGTELEAHASAIREVFLGPPAGATAEPAPKAGSAPMQRLVVARVAEQAGNRAASHTARTVLPPVGVQRSLDDIWEGLSDVAGVVTGAATTAVAVTGDVVTGAVGAVRDISYGMPAERAFVKQMIMGGMVDADALTQMVYALRNPDTALRKLDPKNPADKARIREWKRIKRDLVEPSIKRYKAIETLSPAAVERRVKRATRQAQRGGHSGARADIARDIKRTAKTSVEDWFAGHVPDATFLGLPIRPSSGSSVGGVHKNMASKLNSAEKKLESTPGLRGLSGIDLADAIGLRGLGGLRPPKPASGGNRPSLHCYGLAVDINYSGNPFVGLNGAKVPRMIERATLLMRGVPFKITRPPPEDRGVMEQWLLINSASEDVIAYLNMDEPTIEYMVGELAKSTKLPAYMTKTSWWLKVQRQDRALKRKGDLVGRDPRQTGIMDLDQRLVQALVESGLTWGGMYKRAKDLMHFDDRSLFRAKKRSKE